jgi:hypothetical protein
VSKATEAQAFRLGRCMASVELAKSSIKLALQARDLLPDSSVASLNTAWEHLNGAEQELWRRTGKSKSSSG